MSSSNDRFEKTFSRKKQKDNTSTPMKTNPDKNNDKDKLPPVKSKSPTLQSLKIVIKTSKSKPHTPLDPDSSEPTSKPGTGNKTDEKLTQKRKPETHNAGPDTKKKKKKKTEESWAPEKEAVVGLAAVTKKEVSDNVEAEKKKKKKAKTVGLVKEDKSEVKTEKGDGDNGNVSGLKVAKKDKSDAKAKAKAVGLVKKDKSEAKTEKGDGDNVNVSGVKVVKKDRSEAKEKKEKAKKGEGESCSGSGEKGVKKAATVSRKEKGNDEEEEGAEVVFPMARISRIVKSEGSDYRLSSEAVFLINKASEKFIELFSEDAYGCAIEDRKRSILYKHLSSVVGKGKPFDFLSDFVPEKVTAEKALAVRESSEKLPGEVSNNISAPGHSVN